MQRPAEADGWGKTDSALFLLPSLTCVFILRLSFVIGGGPFFLSCDSQHRIKRRQMEGPAIQTEMGWRGEPRLESHVWCLSPGPHPLCHPLGWCWQMELQDTNPLGTVTQKYETEAEKTAKDEWLDEWKLIHETIRKATESHCAWCMTRVSCPSVSIVLIDNTFTFKKECPWTCFPVFSLSFQVPQYYWYSSDHLMRVTHS